ncbi:MAG TPA: CrcB family protein [Acidimicrobiia bacterium]|nr:CrcB family protein [Acidimicrobiia bacterium]
MLVVGVFAGALGAVSRYVVSGLVQRWTRSLFPVGTMSVNLVGAFLVGFVAAVGNADSMTAVAAAGYLGGFTTFSTWMIETIRLGIPPLRWRSGLNLVLALIAGVLLAAAGYSLGN